MSAERRLAWIAVGALLVPAALVVALLGAVLVAARCA